MFWRNIVALAIAALLSGCAGVGIIATDDPYAKLAQAQQLYTGSGRAMQARRQLDEAIAIFKAKDDEIGLAQAYREYGFLARMGGAEPGVILIRVPSTHIPPSADLDLSNQYFSQSAEILSRKERFDSLSNVYFNLGINQFFYAKHYQPPGKREEACAYFDRALQANREAETRQPGLSVDLPRGVRTFAELTAKAKVEAGCA